MHFSLKAVAAAAAFAVVGSASAAIDGFTTGNGELFFNIYDKDKAVSFVFDLTPTSDASMGSFNLNSFLPNYYRSDAAYRSNLTSAAIAGAPLGASYVETQGRSFGWKVSDLSDWDAFVAASPDSANWRWNVVAGDSTGSQGANHSLRYISTSKDPLGTVDNLATAAGGLLSLSNISANYIAPLNTKTGNEAADFNDFNDKLVATDIYFADKVEEKLLTTGSFNTMANVGESQNFYYITGRPSSTIAAAQFGNAIGAAKWSFAADGKGGFDLSYTAPVPEPGTWAMMAAGLVGLGAFARRRKQA
jgi:hypothetical protein